MRAFVGFFVPEAIKNYVLSLQNELRKLSMSCKMVELNDIHVCLSFLGEVEDGKVSDLCAALTKVCEGNKKFEVFLGDVKTIPSESYIRVIVLEVSDPSGSLKNVCSGVKESIGGDMKPPHLTLCRVKVVSDKFKVLSGIKSLKSTSGLSFPVSSLSLIKSELSRSGPVYNVVYSAELAE